MIPEAIITIVPLVVVIAFILWALGSLMASSGYISGEKRRRTEPRR
jgi:hypothetical protein